jgi:hypothetical protein
VFDIIDARCNHEDEKKTAHKFNNNKPIIKIQTTKCILYSITVPGIQVHVAAYNETIRLQTQIKKLKFSNCNIKIYKKYIEVEV